MNKPEICLFIFLIVTFMAKSQTTDSLLYKYNNQTIYRYGSSFLKGAEKLSFLDLRSEFSVSETGLSAYLKAKRFRTQSKVLRILSFFSGVSSVFVIANNGNRKVALTLLSGQLIAGYGSLKYYQLSAQSLDRAIWQRNKDVLIPSSSPR
jgi:hypothetical protein